MSNITSLKIGSNTLSISSGSSFKIYDRLDLPTVTKTTVTIHRCNVKINGATYNNLSDKVLDLTNSSSWSSSDTDYTVAENRAGVDVYIYAYNDNGLKFILGTSELDSGYLKVGGFHCLCLSVGTIEGHKLSGYVTGDIIPNSVWDLMFRPYSDPEGMVFVDKLNKWIAIYLPSWNGSKIVSKFNQEIIDGESSYPMDGEQFVEFMSDIGGRLPTRDEFKVFSEGSNQKTNIQGSADPVTTGGHVDTAGRRMISDYGIEDCCGAIWQWSSDTYEAMSTSWNSSNAWMDGYSWQTKSVVSTIGDTNRKDFGSCTGLLRRGLLGGDWNDGAYCGSRCVFCGHFGSRVHSGSSGRFVSDVKKYKYSSINK